MRALRATVYAAGLACLSATSTPFAADPPAFNPYTTMSFGTSAGNAPALIYNDVTGDGVADLVAPGDAPKVIAVFPGYRDGTFGSTITSNAVTFGRDIALGHVNADRHLDVVSVSGDDNALRVLINDGTGRFASASSYPIGLFPWGVALGDLNRDSLPDAAVAHNSSAFISVLLATAPGTFGPRTDIPLSRSRDIAMADMNSDARLDVIVARDGGATVFLGNGDGTLKPAMNAEVGDNPERLTVTDLNGDQKLDVVLGGFSNSLMVLLGNGDGTLQQRVVYTTPVSTSDVKAADFTQDGKIDLAAGSHGAFVMVLAGNGDGTFGAPIQIPNLQNTLALVAADFNDDGMADIATGVDSVQATTVMLGRALPTWREGPTYGFADRIATVGAAHLNTDTNVDLFVTRDRGNVVSVLLGSGGGAFQNPRDFTVGGAPCAAASGDFNGDSRVDVVVLNSDDNTVSVLLGSGDAAIFQPKTDYPVGGRAYCSMSSADMNRDGRVDLVVPTVDRQALTLLGNASGGFQAMPPDPSGNPGLNGLDVALGDLTGDGAPDGVAGSSSAQVAIGINDGTGRLIPRGGLTISCGRASLGDVNRDSKLDLIMPNCTGNMLSVLLGAGNGTFGGATTYQTGNWPLAATLIDVNGDGNLDILTSDTTSSTISFLMGRGDGTFAPRRVIYGDAYGYFIAVSGVPGLRAGFLGDLVVPRGENPRLTVLLRRGGVR